MEILGWAEPLNVILSTGQSRKMHLLVSRDGRRNKLCKPAEHHQFGPVESGPNDQTKLPKCGLCTNRYKNGSWGYGPRIRPQ